MKKDGTMFWKIFIIVGFASALALFCFGIYFFTDNDKNISPSYFSAAGTVLAAIISIGIAFSADESSKTSLRISESILDLEIIKEGPVLYLGEDLEGEEKYFVVSNYGQSAAINITCNVFSPTVKTPLFPERDKVNRAFRPNFVLMPEQDSAKKYVMTWENFFGKKFKNEFIITESNAHEGKAVTQRASQYKISDQKISLFEN